MWEISEITHADGGTIKNKYDQDNRLVEQTLPEGGVINYTYDPNGNITTKTDAEGNTTKYKYDKTNRIINKIDAAGNETGYTYDDEGNLICKTDALGNKKTYTYDEMRRCISKTDVLGNTTKYTYDASGNINSIIYANGNVEYRDYCNGRISEIKKVNGTIIRYTYDKNGNCTLVEDGGSVKTAFNYDALNRIETVITPNGGVIRYDYDALGNIIKLTDALGNQTSYSYSPNGNLISVTDALGNETIYSYDKMNRLIKVERVGDNNTFEQENQITTYEWSHEGKLLGAIDPLGAIERYSYDKNGNVTEKCDKDGYNTTYKYDARGLMTYILYSDGTTVAYSYDALRRLEEIKDSTGTTSIKNDALGRVIAVTDAQGKTVGYEWGSANEKKQITYPDGKEAEYNYNSLGQLSEMKTLKGEITYSYDEAGRLKKKGLPNGITTEYSYNNIGKLENIRHTGEKFTEEYKYHYDIAGNKTGVEKARQGVESDNGSFGYGYDSLMRLTEVMKDGNILHKYSYDAFGNRIQKENYSESDMHPTTYQYNQNNQLICMVDEEEQTYTYDKRGNLTEVKSADNLIKAFTYNSANRMSDSFETREGKNKRAEYQYNGLGQRVEQNIYSNDNNSNMQETYPKHPENPEQQINYTIDLTRQYYNLLVSEEKIEKKEQNYYWDTNIVALEEENEEQYYLQDDLGSTMHLMDEMGEIKESYGFDEFGCSIVQEIEKNKTQAKFGYSIQPFGFTGYQKDEVGGLYFAQARRYDAGAGRFVSEDKIQGIIASPITLNRYNYCWNNPIELVDLNGEFPWILIPLLITVSANLTGCGDDSKEQNDSDEIPEPSEQEYEHEYGYVNSEGKYIYVNSPDVYNSEEYRYITNCYAYALDIKNNPITGERFYSTMEQDNSQYKKVFGAQPGLFSGGYEALDESYKSGTKDGNDKLVELINNDVSAMGRTFKEYDDSMSGGYVVLLVVNPGEDYHLYRQDVDGTWSHKQGNRRVELGIKNPVEHAEKEGYTSVVGFYYIKEKCDNE